MTLKISKVFSKTVLFLLRSLFLYGFIEARKGSIAPQLIFAVSTLYIVIRNPYLSLIPFSAILGLYLVFGILNALLYSAIISSIPAMWMALTNLLYLLMAKSSLSLEAFIEIFIRAEIGAITVFSLIQTMNISELCYIVYRVSTTLSQAIEYFWRLSSQMLKETSEMLYVHALKREKIWKTLAMMFVRGDEIAEQFTEGIYLKQFSYTPKPIYSKKTVLLETIMAIIALTTAIILSIH